MNVGVSELVLRREIPKQLLFERGEMQRIRGCALNVRASDRLRVLYADRDGGRLKELHLRTMRSRTLLEPDGGWEVTNVIEVDQQRLLVAEVNTQKGVPKIVDLFLLGLR